MADRFLVSDGVDDDALARAEHYFAEKDAGRGPAQQMMDFAQPLIQATGSSAEGLDKALSLAMVFWNLAVLPEQDREKSIATSMLPGADPKVRGEFHEMADMMIARHQEMFPELHVHR